MRISHKTKNKFIFYAITKTGSSSIRQYFFEHRYPGIAGKRKGLRDENGSITGGYTTGLDDYNAWNFHHTKFGTVKKHFETTEYNYDEYLKFAFTRNPWDRELSDYHFKIKCAEQYNLPDAKAQLKKVGANSFEQWIKGGGGSYDSEMHQHNWIDFNDPKFFVFSYENLQKDFNSMCDMIGVIPKTLACKERGNYNHSHYTEHYDDEMTEIVSKRCAKDIEIFNYKFGE